MRDAHDAGGEGEGDRFLVRKAGGGGYWISGLMGEEACYQGRNVSGLSDLRGRFLLGMKES